MEIKFNDFYKKYNNIDNPIIDIIDTAFTNATGFVINPVAEVDENTVIPNNLRNMWIYKTHINYNVKSKYDFTVIVHWETMDNLVGSFDIKIKESDKNRG